MARNIILLISFFTISFSGHSQVNEEHRDALKVNVTGAAIKIYALQLEKSLNPRLSFVLTGFYRPESSIPFASEIDRIAKSRGLGLTGVNFEYIFIDQAKIGISGASPELRFYLSKKRNRAFIGIFGMYTHYDMNVPASLLVNFRGQDAEVITPILFDINTVTGGLLLGKQFRIGKRLGLDVVVFGPHIGRALNVGAEVNQALLSQLSESEQVTLKSRVIQRFGIDQNYYNTEVNESQATLESTRRVPFLGIRGAGLNLAYYF